ncbi:hypothetical protein [Paenibacillus sp. 1P07SE]|uniref:hypothetical protein n=1 Tax=Paenibacillus sp. 1P07SE TaxID=3132209 RepID=UPI0039A63C09
MVWSALAFLFVMGPLNLLICDAIQRKVKSPLVRIWSYPAGCALTFVLPTAFIMTQFGGGNLLAPESMLFHAFFVTSGIVFGLGYGVITRLTRRR